MLKKLYYQYYKNSEFGKNVFTLMTGTALAQAVPLLLTPVLTRVYAPSVFGFFALYTTIVAIITIIATGQYETSIMLPKEDEKAINIVATSLILIFLISLLTFFILFFFNQPILSILDHKSFSLWLYFIPLSVFFWGSYSNLISWFNRKGRFNLISILKFLQYGGSALFSIIIGLFCFSSRGLVIGFVLGQICAVLFGFTKLFQLDRQLLSKINIERIKEVAKRFKNFPLLVSPGVILNTMSGQMPILLFSRFFNSQIVGFFSLSQRVTSTPIALISKSFSEAFRQKASDVYRTTGSCRELFLTNIRRLFLISIVPFLLLFITAPYFFPILFGKEWGEVGKYVQILSIMYFLDFVLSSISSVVIQISEKFILLMLWQLALLILVIFSLSIGYYFYNSVYYSLYFFVATYALMFFIFFLMAFSFSVKRENILNIKKDLI